MQIVWELDNLAQLGDNKLDFKVTHCCVNSCNQVLYSIV